MMALEDVGGSMLKTRLPHWKHRKASVDLADATVPTGTSLPLSRNSGALFSNLGLEVKLSMLYLSGSLFSPQ